MPLWLSHAIEWLGAGGVGLSFLGTLWAYVLVKGKLIVAAKTKRLVAAYEASKTVEENDDEPRTPLQTEADLVRQLRAQLDAMERSNAIEVRALKRELTDTRKELMEERGKNATLTYATAKLREEYRRSLGLDDEPERANPKSSGAITVPPKSR